MTNAKTKTGIVTPPPTGRKHKTRNSVISVVLIVALFITGLFAFLSATDSKTNVFTVGKIDVELWEDFDADNDGVAENYDSTEKTVTFQDNIVPGNVIEKAPYVKNTGNNEAYVFVSVGIPVDTMANMYTGDGSYEHDGNVEIPVNVYAVQKNYKDATDVESTYAAFLADTFKDMSTDPIDGYDELFNVYSGTSEAEKVAGFNTDSWTKMADYYTTSYHYYVFSFSGNDSDTLNAEATSEKLFNYVEFNADIGKLLTKEDLYMTQAVFSEDTVIINEEPEDGYTIKIGDYKYGWNSAYEDSLYHDFVVSDNPEYRGGWGVHYVGSSENPEPMCNTVGGYPVITAEFCYTWNTFESFPSLPVSVKNMGNFLYNVSGNEVISLCPSFIAPPSMTDAYTFYQGNRFNVLDLSYSNITEFGGSNHALKVNTLVLPDGLSNVYEMDFAGTLTSVKYKGVVYTSRTALLSALRENGVIFPDVEIFPEMEIYLFANTLLSE